MNRKVRKVRHAGAGEEIKIKSTNVPESETGKALRVAVN